MSATRLDLTDASAVSRFIIENTEWLSPPLVPEIKLRLATESVPLWQKTEEELGEINLPPPYWAFAWAGGQALARYLLDNRDLCKDRDVLDLGSGSGLAAIASAMAGAKTVVAADIDPMALSACLINAQGNKVTLEADGADLLARSPGQHDVFIIGDLFYERALADRVLTYIDMALSRGAVVLVGDPQRSYFPASRFRKLEEYAVPVTRELEDAEIKRSAVWRALPLR
jgi:predicted nicotinamide N-methyase